MAFISPSRLALLALVACAGCETVGDVVELHSAAGVVRIAAAPLSIEVRNQAGALLLRSVDARLFASTVDSPLFMPQALPGWDGYTAREAAWKAAPYGKIFRHDERSASLELDADGQRMTVELVLDDARLSMTGRAIDGDANKVAFAFGLGADEHVFGLGERFSSVDHRGLGLYAWAEEGGLGGGEDPSTTHGYPIPNGPSMTYFPVPYSYSTAGYGMRADTTRRTEMHLGDEQPDEWRVAVNGTELPLVFYLHADPLAALDDFTFETGRPLVPAPWVWGNWRRIDRETIVDGQDEWRLMRDRKIPITTIEDAVHFLPQLSFIGIAPQLHAWTHDLHADGYKVLAYNNPYVSASDPNAQLDYAFGKAHGYFERAPDGTPAQTFFVSGEFQMISAVDLTSHDAVYWFQTLLQRTLDFGYDGWQHDFGEYVARSSSFADGRGGEEVHNDFPRLSAKAAYELLAPQRPDDFVFHVRSGYAGTQAYAPVVWGGDPEADFDETQGLPASLRAGLNLGMSGVPTWGSDMTGFKCLTEAPRDKEVFFRWIEMGAVSPIMREENACSNPLTTQTKWSLWNDDDTQTMYRTMASFHTRLAPYFRALALAAHATGVPIMRHPVLLYPREPGAWADEDSFFLGDALYAAPVVRRGVTQRDVWMPPGRYLEWTEGTIATGPGMTTVPAPLDRLPLFLVEDELLPMLDADVQTLAPATDGSVVTEADRRDLLDVIVALGPTGTASLTLADGTRLTAARGPAVMSGTPNTTTAADESALAGCDACSLSGTFGQTSRIRATSPHVTVTELVVEDLRLTSSSPIARRIRWDVRRLP